MTFATLRQAVAQANMFSTNYFAEDVTYTPRANGTPATLRVKIEIDNPQKAKRGMQRDFPASRDQVDVDERLRVVICRDATFSNGGKLATPYIGDTLTRAAAKDPDTRKFVFTGEVLAQCDTHGTYIFSRARRTIDARPG